MDDLSEKIGKFKGTTGVNMDFYEVHKTGNESGKKVIVISEIWGVTAFIKDFSKRLAREGYVAYAPDLYSRPEDKNVFTEENIMDAMRPMWSLPPEKRRDSEAIKQIFSKLNDNGKKIFTKVTQEREQMEKQMISDLKSFYDQTIKNGEKVGVVGFCMGGGLAFQLTTERPFSATAVFYGANPRNLDDLKNVKGAITGFYAGEDSGINAGLSDLVKKVVELKLDFEMKLYPGTYHAFFNDTGMSYNKDASMDAWEKLKHFYRRYLQ
ncbi:dienelactone hydrolase family protein [Caldiplasma sukawensis]